MKKTSNVNGRQVRCGVFGVARSNPSPLFHAKKSVFDQVAHFVEMLVVGSLLDAISLWRNDEFGVFLASQIRDGLGVVCLVGNEEIRRNMAY